MAQRTQCGINIDPTNAKGIPSVGQLQEVSARWVRFVLKVSGESVEALEAAFRRDIYREYISTLAAAGIRIMLVINNETVPTWPVDNMDANAPEWAAYLARYEERCRSIARHYAGQVAAYQIWNEPDYAAPHPGYNPVLAPAVFGQMLKRAYTAIKEADPQAQVITAGLVSGNPVWLEWVKAATGNRIFADAVSVHPYGQRPENDWPWSGWGFGTLKGLLTEYYKRTQPIPLWISELGTSDVNVQGQFPERAYDSLNRNFGAKVPVAFWFCWSDGMVPPFGLRDDAGNIKGAFDSYRKYAQVAGPAGIGAGSGEEEGVAAPAAAADSADADLRNTLLKAAAKRRVIAPETRDPLTAAILADGFVPNSAPFGIELDGVHYRGQRADDPQTGRFRMYYAQGPSGQHVTYVEQEAVQ
jgi:hypothetical protein